MRVLATVAACLLVGCAAPYNAPTPLAPRVGTEVEASFESTWEAAIDFLSESNYRVKTLDRSSGFIIGEELRVSPSDSTYADCGSYGEGEFRVAGRPRLVTYNVLIRGDSAKAIAKVTADYQYQPLNGYDKGYCFSRGAWEKKIEELITKRAQDKRKERPVDSSWKALARSGEEEKYPIRK